MAVFSGDTPARENAGEGVEGMEWDITEEGLLWCARQVWKAALEYIQQVYYDLDTRDRTLWIQKGTENEI